MGRKLLSDKDLQLIEKRQRDLETLYDDLDRAERCGIDCQERRERAKFVDDFFKAVKKEYFADRS